MPASPRNRQQALQGDDMDTTRDAGRDTADSLEASLQGAPSISRALARYVAGYRYDAIDPAARERAKYLMLDGIGIALASTQYDFAYRTLAGLTALSESSGSSVIGFQRGLSLRDAVLMNGLLVHGLDYDDTHVNAIVHPTASALPCALGVAEAMDAGGDALLAAYVLGVEVVTRLGLAAKGAFHHFGFHPTGIAAHFSCALQAGWLHGLTEQQLTMAQGIMGSTASGSQEFLEEGAWNKRVHPGWAGVAGITAASLAKHGFIGPTKVYEGRFGLFKSHLHEKEAESDYSQIVSGLGTRWEVADTSIKPFPICHLIHACADAALELRRRHELRPADIAEVRALLPRETMQIVAEPAENKIRPANSYDAKFSTQYVVATCLARGCFGLAELEPGALVNSEVLALAEKVICVTDPDTLFPKYFSGGLIITTRDGRTFTHHEPINRGCGERALGAEEIVAKFEQNAALAVSSAQADRILKAVLDVERLPAREFALRLQAA
jgi:2-methylcitrate dehydratase PrpD